ncbi:hypothetical protein [Streptacidiphilus sp. P02-A3a]|uniref:hypothetical protein n=1 Tax=Streptacidiphilus sp. P02-A3a TaxID=2704468 RepID=UPI0015FDF3A0|nr:hypothetical protein [Streptacidiphilus sp. P02-A3a]QMU71724.1 hypothetical protein GXP74_29245 [Streptacidiphilus sp. P02-A3a]
MSTPHITRAHQRPVNPCAWLRQRRDRHGLATTTTYTLLLGDRTVSTHQVDARVIASAGYRVGLPSIPGLCRAVSLDSSAGDPGGAEQPTVYLADGTDEAPACRRVEGLTVEAGHDTAPMLRFTSRTGQPLSLESRQAVERASLALIITAGTTLRPCGTSAVGGWHAVVLLPATG